MEQVCSIILIREQCEMECYMQAELRRGRGYLFFKVMLFWLW